MQLLQNGKQQFIDANGAPLASGSVAIYAPNTTNPVTTYQDQAGQIANPNPVPLDSRGQAVIWANGPVRQVVKDAFGVTIWDQIASAPDTSAAANSLAAQLLQSAGASLISYIAQGVGAVTRRILAKLLETISTADYGAKADGLSDDGPAAQKANSVAGARPLVFIGVHRILTPTTITAPIADTMEQIFTTDSAVTIDNGRPVRPEWFGAAAGNIRLAVNALPATGGTVQLESKRYPAPYNSSFGTNAGVDYLAKPNVRVFGRKLPKANAGLTGLEGGTIVEGPFPIFAPGFEADNFGVDSGSDVCTARYGGTAQEGFTFYKPGQAVGGNVPNVTIGKIVGICQSPTAAVHAILMEGIDNLQFHSLRGYMGVHGVIVKSRYVNGVNVYAKGNTNEGLICKSDAYALLDKVNIQNVYVESVDGNLDVGAGVIIEAVTAAGGQVQIGNIEVYKKSTGIIARSNGAALSDVQITNFIADGCSNGIALAGDLRRFHVSQALVNNAVTAVTVSDTVTSKSNEITSLYGANLSGDGVLAFGSLTVKHSFWDTVTGYCFNYGAVTSRLMIGTYLTNNSPKIWPLAQTLSGSWVNQGGAGNATFSVLPWEGKILLGGLIKGGTSGTVAQLSTQIKPAQTMRFTAHGFDGTNYPQVEIIVDINGLVTATNYGAAGSYISLDGVEYPIPM